MLRRDLFERYKVFLKGNAYVREKEKGIGEGWEVSPPGEGDRERRLRSVYCRKDLAKHLGASQANLAKNRPALVPLSHYWKHPVGMGLRTNVVMDSRAQQLGPSSVDCTVCSWGSVRHILLVPQRVPEAQISIQ